MLSNILKIACVGAVITLSACGFSPIYAKKSDDGVTVIQKISIKTYQNRESQILTNFLSDLLNPYGRPKNSAYQLDSKISVKTNELGSQDDSTTTRKTAKVNVAFHLTGHGLNEKFTISRVSGFSETQNSYSTLIAERDAVRKNLSEIAHDAKIRIATILKRQK